MTAQRDVLVALMLDRSTNGGLQVKLVRALEYALAPYQTTGDAMSFFAVITFDLDTTGGRVNSHTYKKISEYLEEENFFKYRHARRAEPFEMPNNTYVAQFDDEEYEHSNEITEELKRSLKAIFEILGVRGRYFVFAGQKWAWAGGDHVS